MQHIDVIAKLRLDPEYVRYEYSLRFKLWRFFDGLRCMVARYIDTFLFKLWLWFEIQWWWKRVND